MNTEQYNLYIEADEEVTTIISRLHVAHHENVALIVPQHSLLLQSIINLRLLAREAKKQKKNIVIVTQDEEGVTFAQKIGIQTIPLSQWQEDSRTREVAQQEDEGEGEGRGMKDLSIAQQSTSATVASQEEFIQDESHYKVTEDHVEDETGETIIRSYQEQIHRKKRPLGMDIAPLKRTKNEAPQQTNPQKLQVSEHTPDEIQSAPPVQKVSETKEDVAQEQQESAPQRPRLFALKEEDAQLKSPSISRSGGNLEKLRAATSPLEQPQLTPRKRLFKRRPSKKQPVEEKAESLETTNKQESTKSIHAFGWIVALFSATLVIGFLILPYNVVKVQLGETTLEERLSLTAKTSFTDVEVERRMIPLRKIEKEISRTTSAPATGKEDVQAGKAYGTLKIYNTFSAQSQALVATTRFESPSGEIFRLVEGTTVPGMITVNGKSEPGVVEVTVEADKTGELGAIGSVKWTIPGFANNKEKFESFYAENESPMTDGNTAGKNATVVTQQDITQLEESSTEGLETHIIEELDALLRETEVLLPDALEYEITRSQSPQTPGTVSKEAEFVVNAKVTAFVFDSQNVDQIIDQTILSQQNLDENSVNKNLSYVNVKMDTADEKVSFEGVVTLETNAEFDVEKFKNNMKGKKQEEIKEILEEDYPFVSEIALKSYPPFLGSKFSRYAWMTAVEVTQDQE